MGAVIVQLCQRDLLRLANDEEVRIPGAEVTVQATYRDESSVDQPALPAAPANRPQGRPKRKKTGQKWMKSLFPGRCYAPGCNVEFQKGTLILYDYDKGRPLCEGHGAQFFPHIDKPEEVKA